MSDISSQLIKDSYNYVLQSDLSTGIVYRIGGNIPVNPKFISGLTINSNFNYSNGTEQPGYVLITDASGNASWGPVSGSSSGDYLPLSGGTVYGDTIFTSGLTATTINLDAIQFNTGATETSAVGKMYWNEEDGTLDLGLKGGNVTLQIGQEELIRVVNKTATNITLLESNYQAVRVTGAQGQRPKVDLALANNDLNSAETIGLVTETILNNQEGFVTTNGLVRNINTTGSLQGETWNDGDILYLSPTIAGRITNIKPSAPNHLIVIGYLVYAHPNNGKIFVKVDNGYELDELHNVQVSGATNGQVLTYSASTQLWVPTTPSAGGTTFTGGTVSGATRFTGGLTANTFSATTYQNLPIDIRVTGGTYSNGVATFRNNTGGTFNVIGLTTPFTGGTVPGATIFTNGLTADTISVKGLLNTQKGTNNGIDLYSNFQITDYGLLFIGRNGSDYDNFGYSQFIVNPEEGFNYYQSNASSSYYSQFRTFNNLIESSVNTDDGSGYIQNIVTNIDNGEFNKVIQTSQTWSVTKDGFSDIGLLGVNTQQEIAYIGDYDYSVSNTYLSVDVSNQNINMYASGNVNVNSTLKATTVSATTYQNLPVDTKILGILYYYNNY